MEHGFPDQLTYGTTCCVEDDALCLKMKRSRFKLLVFGGIMAVAIAIVLFRTQEPDADGRTLSEWLEGTEWIRHSEIRPEATNAIRKIGPAAVPFLLKNLQVKDPAWKIALQQSDYRDKFPYRWLRSTSRQNEQALAGFIGRGQIADLIKLPLTAHANARSTILSPPALPVPGALRTCCPARPCAPLWLPDQSASPPTYPPARRV